jgi:hypothetical protein
MEELTVVARQAYDDARAERYAAANERAVVAFKKQEVKEGGRGGMEGGWVRWAGWMDGWMDGRDE